MIIARLVLAWLTVTAWFLVAGWAGRQLAAGAGATVPAPTDRAVGWTSAEAAVVTLFASLWFDSLGSGGWWLLFLLVGLLVAFPVRLQGTWASTPPRRPDVLLAVVDAARYVGAGALLAWRLR